MAIITEFIEQWKKALWVEVNHLKKQGGSRYTITDGKCLRKQAKGATYWFILTADVLIPDSNPVRVEWQKKVFYGKVVSIEGFDLILEMDEYFGDEISEASLYSEPWGLLEALSKRLDTAMTSENKQKRVHRLLAGTAQTKHPVEKIKGPVNEVYLRSKYNSTTYIWGPPGTGKTYTLSRMIAKNYLMGKNILIMAHSNAATDVLLLEITKYLNEKGSWKSGDILRYGFSADQKVREYKDLLTSKLVENNHPDLQTKIKQLENERARLKKILQLRDSEKDKKSLAEVEENLNSLRKKIKELEAAYVTNAQVLGVTLSKAAMDPLIFERDFDLIVVDEVSMAYIPQVAFAASLGKKIVVCGDFKQLPPIAMSEHPLVAKWLKRDIFEGAKIVEAVERGGIHPNLFMLKEQRRMHPDISKFTNKFIYKNKVFDYKGVKKTRQPIANLNPFPKEAATLVDLSRMGAFCLKESATESRFNLMSALVAMQFILTGKAGGIESIGCITPYKAQARLLSACIQDLIQENPSASGERKVIAATVHKFQGSERDLIIFDNVDSYPQQRAGVLLTDSTSDRLINVAVTRARGKLINIVDKKYIETRIPKTKATRALADHLMEHNEFYSRFELSDLLKEDVVPELSWYTEKDDSKLIEDITQAKQVMISAPFPSKLTSLLWNTLRKVEKSASITIITPQKDGVPITFFEHIPKNLVMPFIILDGEILWAGTPVMSNTGYESSPQPPFIKARLVSKRVVKLLISFLNVHIAKYSQEEVKQKIVSYRPSYTLKQYVTTWDQCPTCRSLRKAETAANGKIILTCRNCGGKGGITRRLLQKYIDHVKLKCRTCNKLFEPVGGSSSLGAECEKCNEKVDVKSLW